MALLLRATAFVWFSRVRRRNAQSYVSLYSSRVNESVGNSPFIHYFDVGRIYRIACVCTMCIGLRTRASAAVDETRHGVRDVVVNVRGSPIVRIEQTIYALKNSYLNISLRLEAYVARMAIIARANFAA